MDPGLEIDAFLVKNAYEKVAIEVMETLLIEWHEVCARYNIKPRQIPIVPFLKCKLFFYKP